jgi:hypothetical protein
LVLSNLIKAETFYREVSALIFGVNMSKTIKIQSPEGTVLEVSRKAFDVIYKQEGFSEVKTKADNLEPEKVGAEATEPEKVGAEATEPEKVDDETAEPEKVNAEVAEPAKVELKAEPAKVEAKAGKPTK